MVYLMMNLIRRLITTSLSTKPQYLVALCGPLTMAMFTFVKYNLLAHIMSTSHIQTNGTLRSKDLTRFDVVDSVLALSDTYVCTG